MIDLRGLKINQVIAGARNAAHFGGVAPGEEVLLLTDSDADPVIVEALSVACAERGAAVYLMARNRPRNPAERLPAALAAAAAAADVVLDCGTTFNIHTKAAWRAIHEYGTRWVSIEPTMRVLASPAATAEIELIGKVTRWVQEAVRGQWLRVTDSDGTDISYFCAYEDAGGGALEFAQMPGTWGVFPAGVCHINPQYGSADGVVYFDAVYKVPGGLAGMGGEHQRWVVEKSWVTEITGGAAGLLKREQAGKRNADYFSEGSIGTNPLAELLLDGGHLFDSRRAGTMHMAVGDERLSGSRISSDIHWDNLLTHPTLTVVETGEIVIRNGYLLALDRLTPDERHRLGPHAKEDHGDPQRPA